MCSKSKKRKKDSTHKKIMFIHIEYSLQVEIHRNYSGVQDTLQINTRVAYILRSSGLQEPSITRSGRPAKKGQISWIPLEHSRWFPQGSAIKLEGSENTINCMRPQKRLATPDARSHNQIDHRFLKRLGIDLVPRELLKAPRLAAPTRPQQQALVIVKGVIGLNG